ncbi:MAG TPA: HD domain-containing phosphohydrolase [Thermodesulfovibrionales bacterium]|nr:HD domain-containing phosphohydrolase [Thermodesulfovibrionales bacterium]
MNLLKNYISTLMSAVSNSMLYEKSHSSIDDFTQRALALLREIHGEAESLEIMIVDEDIIINKKPFREKGAQIKNLMKSLKRKGVSRISFMKGVAFEEMKQIIVDLSTPKSDAKSTPHIKIGIADIKLGVMKPDSGAKLESPRVFSSEQIEKVRAIFSEISLSGNMSVGAVEEVVVNFILNIKNGTNFLRMINPFIARDEYAFTHATNVSILSLSLAEALGFDSDLLRETGIAALLHDVGKLFVDREILDKNGPLDEAEWGQIKLHPIRGARYLARFEGITRLAPVVSFEHHLRYDGKGYPDLHMDDRRQHLCSQIVAIADFFDALRSGRSYREAMDIDKVIYLMKTKTEGMFNPRLADIFVRTVSRARDHQNSGEES